MKLPKITFVLACVVGLALLAWGPRTNAVAHQESAQKSVAQPDTTPPPPTTVTGTITVTFTITAVTAVPSDTTLACGAEAVVSDTYRNYDEEVSAAATKGKSTWTCVATIPYSWALENPSDDTISLTYIIGFPPGGTKTTVPARASTQSGGSAPIKVPKDGAKTEIAVDVTI